MNIRELEAELEEVMASELKFLPNYGYSPKEEMIEIIQKEIDEAYEREKQKQDYYSDDDELEKERTYLCVSQGISRYC
jgi:hypothetical protein